MALTSNLSASPRYSGLMGVLGGGFGSLSGPSSPVSTAGTGVGASPAGVGGVGGAVTGAQMPRAGFSGGLLGRPAQFGSYSQGVPAWFQGGLGGHLGGTHPIMGPGVRLGPSAANMLGTSSSLAALASLLRGMVA